MKKNITAKSGQVHTTILFLFFHSFINSPLTPISLIGFEINKYWLNFYSSFFRCPIHWRQPNWPFFSFLLFDLYKKKKSMITSSCTSVLGFPSWPRKYVRKLESSRISSYSFLKILIDLSFISFLYYINKSIIHDSY